MINTLHSFFLQEPLRTQEIEIRTKIKYTSRLNNTLFSIKQKKTQDGSHAGNRHSSHKKECILDRRERRLRRLLMRRLMRQLKRRDP